MEAKHIIVIQRNHKFLKEFLMVEPVLDALLQDGVFTQEDYDNCRQAGPGKCEMLLEILKKKGVEGYRTLCGVLDSTQPFIKERLDATSLEGGSSHLVYVNRFKLEAEYSKERDEIKEQMSELHSAMETQKEQLKQKDLEYAELEEVLKKERDEHISLTEKLKEEVEALKVELSKSNDGLQRSQAECNSLKKTLLEEQKAYEALSGIPRAQSPGIEDIIVNVQERGPSDRPCQFSVPSCCEETHLCLLPCLHSACKSCIDHHAVKTNQTCLKCPCGRDFNVEQLQVDHVGRNEAAHAAIVEGENKCNYMDGDHDVKAEVYCHECDCLLCSDCHKHHDLPKRNRGHSMDEVSQADPIPMKLWLKEHNCKDHPSNELQLYDHTCKKAICIVCLRGDHEHHKNEDLGRSHENTRLQLEEQLQKQRLKLKDVKDKIGTVNRHREELGNTQRRLEQEVTAVSKRVAVKLLHRQTKLREEIQMSLDNTHEVVQENLDSLHNVQSSIISTIDYTQRTLESTRREELITLSATIQEKCDENLKRELPEDDTRDTRILLSFQGLTALEELIDTFGGLAFSPDLDHIPDSQPTLQDLHLQNNLLTKSSKVHEDRWHHLEQILHLLTGPDSSAEGSPEPFTNLLTTQVLYEAMENVLAASSVTVYFVGDHNIIGVVCPKIHLDSARANTEWCHVNEDGELVNSPPATQHRHSGRLRDYLGTCASTPIHLPPSPSAVTPHTPQYWETHSRVGVVRGGWWFPALEVGVGEESQVDSGWYVGHQPRSWCVSVGRCGTHWGSLCTRVWQQGEEGECYTNTMSATPGTQATLHHGVVLDVGRGRLAFIDLDREVVLAKMDVEWRESLLPMFGVGPPYPCTVNMKVISGADITMTDNKKSLIHDALN